MSYNIRFAKSNEVPMFSFHELLLQTSAYVHATQPLTEKCCNYLKGIRNSEKIQKLNELP